MKRTISIEAQSLNGWLDALANGMSAAIFEDIVEDLYPVSFLPAQESFPRDPMTN